MLLTPKSAFLGPKLWKKPITSQELSESGNSELEVNGTMDTTGAEFSVMNINDFLNENNFDFGRNSPLISAEDIFDDDTKIQREDSPSLEASVYR